MKIEKIDFFCLRAGAKYILNLKPQVTTDKMILNQRGLLNIKCNIWPKIYNIENSIDFTISVNHKRSLNACFGGMIGTKKRWRMDI